jgi:hypothetical protein
MITSKTITIPEMIASRMAATPFTMAIKQLPMTPKIAPIC